MTTQDHIEQVLSAMSALIVAHANRFYSEWASPGGDAERSDDYIKNQQNIVCGLRKIREDFENLMTGFVEK